MAQMAESCQQQHEQQDGCRFGAVTCRSTQGAVVEEAIGRIVTTAAHSGSAVFVEVGLALFLKVGSRGLEERASMVRVWSATEP